MKNLKRVLSLGLALVMLLGCMMVAGAAEVKTSDLTDMADVKNVKAVTLLVDLGIINGIEQADGTYKYEPAGNIDRSSWAKMVYYVLEGNNSADPYVGTVTTLKDIAGWWAEGQISYLNSIGIVNGDDLGNFNIRANIRVDEAAKMLLCAAGWDAADKGYIGDSWSGSIMRDARKLGLMDGIDQSANAPLTRDNAAQMVYNAMALAVQVPHYARDNGEKYVDRYDPAEVTLGYQTFGIQKVTAVVEKLEDGKATFRDGSVKAGGLAINDGLLDGAIAADASIVGQSVEFFVTGNFKFDKEGNVIAPVPTTGLTIVSSALSAGGATLLATSDAGIHFGTTNWYDAKVEKEGKEVKNDSFIVAKDDTVYYSVNGSDLTNTCTTDLKGGNKVEFYDTDGSGKADLVRVFNYTVGTVDKIETKVQNDVEKIKITGVTPNFIATSLVKGAEGLAEGDVVLYYHIKGAAANGTVIEKAESVKVTPTDVDSDGNLIAGGTKYAESALVIGTDAALGFDAWDDNFGIEWTFYLDKAGKVCAATTEVAPVSTDYVVVLAAADVAGTGGLNGTAGYTEIQILHLDGSDEIVKLAKLYNAPVGDADPVEVEDAKATNVTVGKFYEASKDADNNYTLTAVASSKVVSIVDAETDITAALNFTDSTSNPEARNSTKFIVGKGDKKNGYVYTTYEGYKNVPGMTASTVEILKNTNGTAKYVYLLTDSFAGEGATGMYYLRNTSWSSNNANGSYVMNVVTPEGEEATLEVSKDVREDLTAADKFFTVDKTNEKGVVTGVTVVEDSEFVELTGWSDGALTLTGKESQEYDAETVVIIIDRVDGKYDSASATVGTSFSLDADNYDYLANVSPATGVADTVVVIRSPKAAE